MIPKVFHRIWIGDRPLPDEFKRYGDTWLKHNPDWEMKLHGEEELRALTDAWCGTLTQLADTCRELRHRTNLYRYALMFEYGGVYVDTDFECLQNIEPLLVMWNGYMFQGPAEPTRVVCDFVAGAQLDDLHQPGYLANGFFACAPKHVLMNEMMIAAPMARVVGLRQPDAFSRSHFGPFLFTKVVMSESPFGKARLRILPRPLLYPYSWDELEKKDGPFPGAFAVHHWAARTQPFAGKMIRPPI